MQQSKYRSRPQYWWLSNNGEYWQLMRSLWDSKCTCTTSGTVSIGAYNVHCWVLEHTCSGITLDSSLSHCRNHTTLTKYTVPCRYYPIRLIAQPMMCTNMVECSGGSGTTSLLQQHSHSSMQGMGKMTWLHCTTTINPHSPQGSNITTQLNIVTASLTINYISFHTIWTAPRTTGKYIGSLSL